MTQSNRRPVKNTPRPVRKSASAFPRAGLRPLAILIMLLGVAGFVASRVMFGDQMIFLLGSTLITFAGFALIVAARLNGWTQPESGGRGSQHEVGEQIPMVDSAPAEEAWMEALAERQSGYQPDVQSLPAQAEALFRGLGANVTVEASRPGRSILRIQGPGGSIYTAIVLDMSEPVDVAEARALLALVSNSGSTAGFLIADEGFTPRAIQWAQGKPIQLVEANRLNSIHF